MMGDFEQLGDVMRMSALNRRKRDAAAGRTERSGKQRIVAASGDVSPSSEETRGDALGLGEEGERLPIPMTGRPQRTTRSVVPSDPRDATIEAPSQQEVCPLCKGAQWLRCDLPPWHPQYRKMVECACLLQKRREKRRQQLHELSGLPAQDLLPTLQTFRPQVRGVQEAFRVTREFINAAGAIREVGDERERRSALGQLGWVVLRGPVGAGKTHLAMALSAAALDLGIETLFSTVPDLLDHLRATFAPTSEIVYDELFERMKKAELLVLDDLGTQRSSSWADEKLFQMFNYRYNHRLPTFITLNERAWEHLDERVRSRMTDASLVQLVVMRDAQDYRPRQRKNATSGSPAGTEE